MEDATGQNKQVPDRMVKVIVSDEEWDTYLKEDFGAIKKEVVRV